MIGNLLKRLRSDRRGIATVEFAICLPFLVTLYLGGYQLADAISAYRKVTSASRAVADLTSQFASVSDGDLDNILGASQQIMVPYDIKNAKLTVTQVKVDPTTGEGSVDWSRGLNVNPLTPGTAFALPASIKVKGTYLIVGSIDYMYNPVAASSLIGSIPMHDQIILSPRTSPSITYKGA